VVDISAFTTMVAGEHGLSEVTTLRPDATMQASVVNAGVLAHPVTRDDIVAFVARGGAHKLAHLRARDQITVVIRVGWEWIAVEGTAELIGPDDPRPELDAEAVRVLLRDIFSAAGGTHDDWDAYDNVMADERRTAVLVTPRRIYSNARA
jgi:PPOX class probable F420-dependent enzyme